MNALFNIGTRK